MQANLRFDPELLYVDAAFKDLGLVDIFFIERERFEVDGANVVSQFLTAHKVPEEQVRVAWEAIAFLALRVMLGLSGRQRLVLAYP